MDRYKILTETRWRGCARDLPCMTSAEAQKVKVTRYRDVSAARIL